MRGKTHAALALTGLAVGALGAFAWQALRPPPAVLWLRSSSPVRVIDHFRYQEPRDFTRSGPTRIAPDGAATTWGRFRTRILHGEVWAGRPEPVARALWRAGLPVPRERFVFTGRSEPVPGGTAWEFALSPPE